MSKLASGLLPSPIRKSMRWTYRHLWRRATESVPEAACFVSRHIGIAVAQKAFDYGNGELHPQTRRHIELLEFIREQHISYECSLLDVGCGRGWLLERLYEAGFRRLAGCDWLDESELSSTARSNAEYFRTDLNVDGLSSYPDRSVDIIISSDVLEHLENPAGMIREFERVLAPSGHIFITIPNAFNLYERWYIFRNGNSSRYRSELRSAPFNHISMLPFWVLESLCERAGLEIVSQGKGFVSWRRHFWFPKKKFGHFFSYNASYQLKRKEPWL